MNDILQSIVAAAHQMSWLEIVANLTFAASVILCNYRRWENYPLGIVGTICFFFVFWHARLYNLAATQVWLTGVQVYGWWFWLYGKNGSAPPITRAWPGWLAWSAVFTAFTTLLTSSISAHFGGAMSFADAGIFALTVVAQFYMDRKKLENWIVWLVINSISVPLFWYEGLYLTSLIYAGFWVNAFFGYFMWLKEYNSYPVELIAIHGQEAEEYVRTLLEAGKSAESPQTTSDNLT